MPTDEMFRENNEIVRCGRIGVYTVAALAMMLAAIERYFMLRWPEVDQVRGRKDW